MDRHAALAIRVKMKGIRKDLILSRRSSPTTTSLRGDPDEAIHPRFSDEEAHLSLLQTKRKWTATSATASSQ